MSDSSSSTPRFVRGLLFVLVASAAYLYPFPQANLFYPAMVVIHTLVGGVAAIVGITQLRRLLRQGNWIWKGGWLLLGAGAALGLLLIYTGTARSEFRWLYVHIVLSLTGVGCLLSESLGRRGWIGANAALRLVVCLAALGALGWAAHYQRESRWLQSSVIRNPEMPPETMNGEGDGPAGPFFPSSAQVYGGQKIPEHLFYGVGVVQALPRRYLQPVEQLGAPFLVVQQSVVSQVDRVHAGHGRDAAVEMVRRMP